MTLDEALQKAGSSIDELCEQQVIELTDLLRSQGATDDELAAAMEGHRMSWAAVRRRLLEEVRAVWHTGERVQ